MPVETSIPGAPVQWWEEVYYPNPDVSEIPGTTVVNPRAYWAAPWSQPAGATSATDLLGASIASGAPAGLRSYALYQRRLCQQFSTMGAGAITVLRAYVFPWWTFHPSDGASYNPGFTESEAARVAWFRLGVSFTDLTLASRDVAISWIPYFGSGVLATAIPGGATFVGGWALHPIAAGGLEFRSYDATGVSVFGVAVPLTGPLTQWNTIDVVLTNSRPGTAGTLKLYVGGTLFHSDTFGSATLPAPATVGGTVYTHALCASIRAFNTNGSGMNWWWRARFGRFLPDGTEVLG